MKQKIHLISIALSIALLAGCAGMRGGYSHNPSSLSGDDYLVLSNSAQGQKKQQYLLLAADRFSQNQNSNKAQQVLNSMDRNPLTPSLQSEKQILQAQVWLDQHRNNDAITLLNETAASNVELSTTMQIKLHRLLADAYQAQGNVLTSIDQRNEALSLLPSGRAKQAALLQIWESVENQPVANLQALQQEATNDNEHGWLSLALLSKQNSSTADIVQNIEQWRNQFPDHPAQTLLGHMQANRIAVTHMPQRIALLLPLSGPLAKQANAIRNGFLAAYYRGKSQGLKPKVSVLDTTKGDINAIYQQAVQQGAELIVGPLTKYNVARLVDNNDFTVPTLALNNLDNNNSRIKNLFQFGFSPIDEARQTATKMWNDHHDHVIVIAPANNWSDNIVKAFQQQWQSLGGTIVTQLRLNQHKKLNRDIRQLLNIDKATQRQAQMHYLTHSKIRFIPRRRKDFDAIFLVANPKKARQVLPLLRFYYAGNVPTYAISSIFPGISRPRVDHDINGVIFSDMPWVVAHQVSPSLIQTQQRIKILWGNSYRHYVRLYGLGVDAYNLIPQLGKLSLLPQFSVSGATGTLYLLPNQHIYRKLLWVRMSRGRPRLLPRS